MTLPEDNIEQSNKKESADLSEQREKESAALETQKETEKVAKDLGRELSADQRLVDYFSATPENLSVAIAKASKKILARAINTQDREDLVELIKESAVWESIESGKRENQYVHGTGTNALFQILRQGEMIPRGDEFGGGDVVQGHKTDKTESGEREAYISVAENNGNGYPLAYIYAKGFARPKDQNLAINADVINESNIVLEEWDARSKEERERLMKKHGWTREQLEAVSERPHYFRPEAEKKKLVIFRDVIDILTASQFPEVPANTDHSGEIDQFLSEETDEKITAEEYYKAKRAIYAKIKYKLSEHPDRTLQNYIEEYQELLERTKNQLQRFNKLPLDEQIQKRFQQSILLILDKNEINKGLVKTTKKDWQGVEQPIHPSGAEARIYGKIDLSAITVIQAPKAVLPEIQAEIDHLVSETSDSEVIEKLRSIELIPQELYEVERIVKKELSELGESTENNELTVESDSLVLEQALRKIQEKIKLLKESSSDWTNADNSSQELSDNQAREAELIKIISKRAREMMKQDQYADFAKRTEASVAKEFDRVTESIPEGPEKDELTRQALTGLIEYLKPRVETFVKESNLLNATALEEVLRKIDASVAADKKQFMAGMSEALRPITSAWKENPQAGEPMERAQRKEFARSSIDGVKFEIIPGTDDILSYGLGPDDIHLHLAPMRTLSSIAKLNFFKKTVPNALRTLAETVRKNEGVKEISGTSYVVAAMPDVFRNYGFAISAMEPEYRSKYWGGEKRPVLKASISREDFLNKYGK